MRILNDHYMVVVDQEFEVVRLTSGFDSLNSAYFEENHGKKYKFKRQWGTVVGVPSMFTDIVIDIVDTGIPQQRKFIPSEFIQAQANQGYRKLPVYWPSGFDDFEKITHADLGAKMDVKIGDKVYFDYVVTDQENFLGMHQGSKMFKCCVDQIYCVVREEKSRVDKRYHKRIIMQGGWALIQPDVETWEEIKTPTGLLKKHNPEAKFMIGFVKHIRVRDDIKPGDHIVYERNSDYSVAIEGKIYYVMYEADILCRL